MQRHMLLRAAGYNLVNNGTDMRLIQAFPGHRTPNMTVLYTDVSPKRLTTVQLLLGNGDLRHSNDPGEAASA